MGPTLAGVEVAEVHSVVRRATGDFKDVHTALVRFDNDCDAQLTHSYTSGGRLARDEIHGDGISAYLEGGRGGEIHIVDEAPAPIKTQAPDAASAQAQHCVDCVRRQRISTKR